MLVRDNKVSNSYIYFDFKRKRTCFLFVKKVVAIFDDKKTMHIKCKSKKLTKYEVEPGVHTIRIYTNFLSLKLGEAFIKVNLEPGEKRVLVYTPPIFSFRKGNIIGKEKV
ncbi:MAG: hypothetical protein E7213_06725 [Clostridium sp.]|nr:hypothetical protein [Clostridium sp.]